MCARDGCPTPGPLHSTLAAAAVETQSCAGDFLTLGAYAPEGYGTWCVCVCVCVCVRHHESCHYAQLSVQPEVPTASAQSGKHFKYGFVQKYVLTATSYGADGAIFRQIF